MAEFKLVLNDPKTGKAYQREVKDADAKAFVGMKIGEKIKGETIGLTGYEFSITGGSNKAGFPMRKDVKGTGRKKILATGGVGIRKNLKRGERIRKSVCGNTIDAQISQINLKVEKFGKESLGGETEAPAEEAKPEEKPQEKAEDKKEE